MGYFAQGNMRDLIPPLAIAEFDVVDVFFVALFDLVVRTNQLRGANFVNGDGYRRSGGRDPSKDRLRLRRPPAARERRQTGMTIVPIANRSLIDVTKPDRRFSRRVSIAIVHGSANGCMFTSDDAREAVRRVHARN